MLKRKHMFTAFLVFCIAVTLFASVITIGNQSEYDPWADLDDNGEIDIFDALILAGVFGSEGTPINKTDLILELQSRVDRLNASLIELKTLLKPDTPEFIILDATPEFQMSSVRVILWNVGNQDAHEVTIRYNLTALENEWVNLIGNTTIPSLKAGEIGRIAVTWTEVRRVSSGLYTVHIEIFVSCREGVTTQDIVEKEGGL